MKAKLTIKVETSNHPYSFCSEYSICKYDSSTYTTLCDDDEIPLLYKNNKYGFLNEFNQSDWQYCIIAHYIDSRQFKNCDCINSKKSIKNDIKKHDIKVTLLSVELLDEASYDLNKDYTLDYYSY